MSLDQLIYLKKKKKDIVFLWKGLQEDNSIIIIVYYKPIIDHIIKIQIIKNYMP